MLYPLSSRSRLAAITLLAFAATLSTASAQQKRAMTIVDLIDLPQVGSPRLSPDGTELLYTRSDTDWEKNGRTTHIHRIGTDGSGDVRLTNGEHGESGPRWSPDGGWVTFLARRGESPFSQIHRMSKPGRGSVAADAAREFGAVLRVLTGRRAHLLHRSRSEDRGGEEEGRPARRLLCLR